MFEYCKVRHVDPSYDFFGTVDYGIKKAGGDPMVFYSVVKGGPAEEFHLYPVVSFKEIVSRHGFKAKTLSELFHKRAKKASGGTVEVECSHLSQEALRSTILEDIADLPDELKTNLESAIGEVF